MFLKCLRIRQTKMSRRKRIYVQDKKQVEDGLECLEFRLALSERGEMPRIELACQKREERIQI